MNYKLFINVVSTAGRIKIEEKSKYYCVSQLALYDNYYAPELNLPLHISLGIN
jgi:hypothetical protein